MKKILIAPVMIALFAVSQPVLSSDDESLSTRCEEQAVEDNIDAASHDNYIKECVSFYQDSDIQSQDDAAVTEEEGEKN